MAGGIGPVEREKPGEAYRDGLQIKADKLARLRAETQKELDALMPSTQSVAKAFVGEL